MSQDERRSERGTETLSVPFERAEEGETEEAKDSYRVKKSSPTLSIPSRYLPLR